MRDDPCNTPKTNNIDDEGGKLAAIDVICSNDDLLIIIPDSNNKHQDLEAFLYRADSSAGHQKL